MKFTLLLLFSLPLFGQTYNLFEGSSRKYFEIKESHLDKGMVEEGPTYRYEFHIQNRTNDTLKFDHSSVRSSCGCVYGRLSKLIFPPQDTGLVIAQFSSAARVGTITKSLTINYKEQYVMVYLAAIVYQKDTTYYSPKEIARGARLELEANEFDLGVVKHLERDTIVIKIKNAGKDTLKIQEVKATSFTPQFVLLNDKNKVVQYLKKGKSGYVKLVYPGFRAGTLYEVINLITNDRKTRIHKVYLKATVE